MNLRPWLELARISNLPTAWTNVLAGWLLAGGRMEDPRVLWLVVGGSLLYSGGMVLNDAADAAFDREHKKERPIPSGRVTSRPAWTGGLAALILGSVLCVFLGGASLGFTALLVAAILAYDLYHKPWAGAVFVMGACRVLLYLVAGSAVWGGVTSENLLLGALSIGAYIVGLTMVARLESRREPVGWFTILGSRALLYTPGFVAAFGLLHGGAVEVAILIFAFALLIGLASRLMRKGGAEIGCAVGWLLAGIALVDALAVAQVSFPLAFAFAAAVPLLRLWQRKIAAT